CIASRRAGMSELEHHLRHQQEGLRRDFFWHELRSRAITSFLPDDEPFELVDVGAGAGFLGHYLRTYRPRCRYAFTEPIRSLAERLEHTFGKEANAASRPDFRSARFVTLLDVLEHQEDERAFLLDLADKMAPRATLLLTVPALRALWSLWDVL